MKKIKLKIYSCAILTSLMNITTFKRIVVCLFVAFMMLSCEKQSVEPLNLKLFDKDISTIQTYIQGKWICAYGIGGIAYGYHHHYDGFTFEFTADKKYIISGSSGTEQIQYDWVKILGVYAGYNDSVYMMTPNNIVFDEIKNDTLIYHDVASDAIWYYLIKYKN
jgi:hypothetical protein